MPQGGGGKKHRARTDSAAIVRLGRVSPMWPTFITDTSFDVEVKSAYPFMCFPVSFKIEKKWFDVFEDFSIGVSRLSFVKQNFLTRKRCFE